MVNHLLNEPTNVGQNNIIIVSVLIPVGVIVLIVLIIFLVKKRKKIITGNTVISLEAPIAR